MRRIKLIPHNASPKIIIITAYFFKDYYIKNLWLMSRYFPT